MTLDKLQRFQRARISALPNDAELSMRLLEQGFVPKTIVQLVHKAPFCGPLAFSLLGTKISIGKDTASNIQVEVM